MSVKKSMTQMIGNTPLLEIPHPTCRILCKMECQNPGGSVKDRAAFFMIENAKAQGLLTSNTQIIEATSGNTGIGLCAIAAAQGYPITIVMPDNMSMERRQLMAAYGAKIVLSPAADGMSGAISLAEKLAAEAGNAYIPGQFSNPANIQAHYETTAPEIWRDTDGAVDVFVAGIGTGGTITGTGKYLKEKNAKVQVVGIEPAGSAVLSGGKAGPHGIQGIGAGFVPPLLDQSFVDEIVPVADEDAFAQTKAFAREQGILVGISSGAALHAAYQLAARPENAGKTIVVLLPDSGSRYLSTGIFG